MNNHQWIDRLGVSGHSADESDYDDEGNVHYVVNQLPWRAGDLTQYVRALDVLHLSTRYKSSGRRMPGPLPHFRSTTPKRIDAGATPVPGLPCNFYDKDWLATLDESELHALRIQDFEIDLHIPPFLRE